MEHLDVAMAKYYEMTCGQCGMKSEPIFNSELADRWLKMHYEKRHREALPGLERRLLAGLPVVRLPPRFMSDPEYV